ncbi:DUF3013 family protein [Lactococcus nasutitermitis]|uniref:DUF3013 family protein n=1 Tax=Lactococcus nasutitermitis TaxID=1652957 RepID=A0ABV9JDZ7_9LACT|nr:DUF3013 family protein [Lactococcus nasutitermitis]
MAKHGFLDILDEELEKNFNYDYEINWDKRNFAVEISFLLEAENVQHIALTDAEGVESDENIIYEDSIIFYNPVKSHFDSEDYLTAISYPEKGLSREFLAYFTEYLQETVDTGMDDLIDFLTDDSAEEFSINWDNEKFLTELSKISETEFFKYPRY